MVRQSIRIDKRSRVIEAAAELFRESHNVRKVSIEEIAASARVSPTTIYHYFGTREALVAEVAKMLVRAFIDRTREFLHSPMPFAEKIQAITSGKMQLLSSVNDEVVNKMASQDRTMAKFVEQIYTSELTALWREFLSDGKAEGYIDRDLDEDVFAVYLDTLRIGFGAKSEQLQNLLKNPRLLQQMSRLVAYGFMRKEVDLFGGSRNQSRSADDRKRSRKSSTG
jgi:AcrR family transcriptional regulator